MPTRIIVPSLGCIMPNLLLVGKEPGLLTTRAWVLAKADATVIEASPAQVNSLLATQDFDLVFVCHTLDASERILLARQVHISQPAACIIQVRGLLESYSSDRSNTANDVVSCEPIRIVEAAQRLLARSDVRNIA